VGEEGEEDLLQDLVEMVEPQEMELQDLMEQGQGEEER
jgi:hypothetical protein